MTHRFDRMARATTPRRPGHDESGEPARHGRRAVDVRRRLLAVGAVAAMLVVGCGDADDDTVAGSSLTSGEPPTVSLEVSYRNDDADIGFDYGIECGPDERVTGAADESGVAAAEACELLNDPVVRDRLIDGPGDRVCAEVYGGADAASITGTVGGEPVDTTIDRTNGCGISDWDELLTPILPPPIGLPGDDGV